MRQAGPHAVLTVGCCHAETHAMLGKDVIRVAGVVPQLLTQVLYICSQELQVTQVGRPPGLFAVDDRVSTRDRRWSRARIADRIRSQLA